MVFAMMPMSAGTVFASENKNPGLEFGTGVLETGANTDNDPVAWCVIKYKNTGNSYIESNNTMTLFAADNLTSGVHFNPSTNNNNDYKDSNLKSVVDGMYSSLFSNQEQSAIESRTLGVNEYVGQEPYSTGFGQLRW